MKIFKYIIIINNGDQNKDDLELNNIGNGRGSLNIQFTIE